MEDVQMVQTESPSRPLTL